MFEALEGSLRRLGTDRIDVYFNHAVNDPARLRNDEWFEFVSRAKQQGKIRFSGMSGHGGRLVECLDLAVDEKLVDVVLVAFNFGQDPEFHERFTGSFDFVARQPELPRVLAKARAAGVGVIAMKTLRGGKLNDMRPYEGAGATFAQAAFRWIFATGLADALVVTMKSQDAGGRVPRRLGLDRSPPGRRRRCCAATRAAPSARSAATAAATARTRARPRSRSPTCCARACTPSTTRSRASRSQALAEAGGAAACLTCDGTPCASACPHGVTIPELTRQVAALGLRS